MMELSLTHFGAVDTITVVLEPGLNAVLGRNGAGKSTLVNAFYIALVGDPIDGATCKDLITWGFTEATIKLTTDTFEIVRKLTSTGVKHRMTIGSEVITKKTEISDRIISLYNLPSIETFKNVYFAEQYRAIDFIYGTNSSRLDTLSNIFGLKKFETIRSKLHDVASSIAVETISDDLLEQLRVGAEQAAEQLSVFDAELLIVQSNVLDDTTYAELADTASKCYTQQEYDNVVARLEAAQSLERDVNAELEMLTKGPTAEQREEYAKAYRYQQLKPDFDEAEKHYKQTLAERHPSEESIIKMCADIDTYIGTLNAKKASILERKNLLSSGKCPITGGAPCYDLTAMADPTALAADIAKIDEELAQALMDKEGAKQLSTEARIYSKKVADATARYENLRGLIQSVSAYKDFDFAKWDALNIDVDAVDKKRTDLLTQLAGISVELNRLNELLTTADAYPRIASEADRQAAVDKIKAHDDACSKLAVMTKTRETLAATCRTAEASYSEALSSISSSQKMRDIKKHFETLRNLLHRDNVPRLLLEGVRDDLNKKLDEYVSMFELPYELDWTADGDLLYKSINSDWCSTRMLSGGQKYILMLSLRWAFAELLSSVFPVLVLDEPTTGLDTVNRQLLAETLLSISDMLGTRGMSLLIPTHDETIIQNAQNIIKIGE